MTAFTAASRSVRAWGCGTLLAPRGQCSGRPTASPREHASAGEPSLHPARHWPRARWDAQRPAGLARSSPSRRPTRRPVRYPPRRRHPSSSSSRAPRRHPSSARIRLIGTSWLPAWSAHAPTCSRWRGQAGSIPARPALELYRHWQRSREQPSRATRWRGRSRWRGQPPESWRKARMLWPKGCK